MNQELPFTDSIFNSDFNKVQFAIISELGVFIVMVMNNLEATTKNHVYEK